MKLRIRSSESKETLKIQTPSPSSLQDLKDAIAENISAPPETLQLSLNRKDKLDAAPHESLQSLGIASGDLIFYTLNPNGFSGHALIQTPTQDQSTRIQASKLEKTLEQQEISHQYNTSDFNSEETEETLTLAQEEETPGFSEGIDENPTVLVENALSVPCFLRKVFKEEVGNTEGDHKLLIIAVHAVFLESGFVGFDSATQKKIDGFHLPEGWASKSTVVSLRYTVPDLVGSGGDVVETVVLMFQTLGKYVNVYGSLSRYGADLYSLCLDKSRFVPSINFVWMNCDSVGAMDEKDGSSKSSHEREVFEFWKNAKDRLALPLLTDLCEKTGLAPPPCFTCLPTDLKLRILEFLSGAEIAKIGCVSSELRYLSSINDLWKLKFAEEFKVSDVGAMKGDHWKELFVVYWEKKKRKRRAQRPQPFHRPYYFPVRFPGRRDPGTFGFPGMIGGDHDLFPAPFGTRPIPYSPVQRNFTRHCNLGGFNRQL